MTNPTTDAPDSTRTLVERLLKMAHCVHIAVEASVADDLSDGLTKAADLITHQQKKIEALKGALSLDGANIDRIYDALPKYGPDQEAYYSLTAIRTILSAASRAAIEAKP